MGNFSKETNISSCKIYNPVQLSYLPELKLVISSPKGSFLEKETFNFLTIVQFTKKHITAEKCLKPGIFLVVIFFFATMPTQVKKQILKNIAIVYSIEV